MYIHAYRIWNKLIEKYLFEGIVIWFEVALVHIPYTAEFININQRIELAFKQVAYGISYMRKLKPLYYKHFDLYYDIKLNIRLPSKKPANNRKHPN